MPLVIAHVGALLDFATDLAPGGLLPPDPLWLRRQSAQTARGLPSERRTIKGGLLLASETGLVLESAPGSIPISV